MAKAKADTTEYELPFAFEMVLSKGSANDFYVYAESKDAAISKVVAIMNQFYDIDLNPWIKFNGRAMSHTPEVRVLINEINGGSYSIGSIDSYTYAESRLKELGVKERRTNNE